MAVIDEYLAWLDMDLSYRGFAAEMADFDRLFSPPSGCFFLGLAADGTPAGCAGYLRHPGDRAEIKRLYVRPAFRGLGLGERLVHAVLGAARGAGCRIAILDAVPQTGFAMGLYERMGFDPCAPFYPDPVPGTRFYAMRLQPVG